MDSSPHRRHGHSHSQAVAASASASATQGEASRSTEGPTAAAWAAFREEIGILYATHPLKDVRKIMDQRHKFRATDRMYKARFAQWKFNKNTSDREYQVCIVKHKVRRDQGKLSSAFLIHGHPRSLKDLRKFIKGRKMTEDDFLAQALQNVSNEQLQDDSHIRAFTPESEPDVAENRHSVSGLEGPAVVKGSGEIALGAPSTHSYPTRAPTLLHPLRSNAGRESVSLSRPSPPHVSAQLPLDADGPESPGLLLSPHSSLSNRHYATRPSSSSSHGRSSALKMRSPPTSHRPTSQDGFSQSLPQCTHVNRDIDMMAYQSIYSKSLGSIYGTEDLDGWPMLSSRSSTTDSTMQDYEIICPKCGQSTSSHFASLENFESPPSSVEAPSRRRDLFHATPEVPSGAMTVPPSAKEHDHSWKWVARSFMLCIAITWEQTEKAELASADADREFEAMIRDNDPKIIMALNQTLTVLHMHDQGSICRRIIASARDVSIRVLGKDHPISIIARWMVYVAEPETLKTQDEITSSDLHDVWQQFVHIHGQRDHRSIASMYCYGYMLNFERNLEEAEHIVSTCYRLACDVLGRTSVTAITAMTNLRLCFERQNRIEDAIEAAKIAIDDSRETFGRNHPRRLETMRLLGVSYVTQGRLKEAEVLYWQVLEGWVRMLGRNHKFTNGMKRTMIKLQKKMGQWREEEDGGCVAATKINDLWDWDPNEPWGPDSPSSMEVQTLAF